MMGYHLKFMDSIGKKTHRIDFGYMGIDTGVKKWLFFCQCTHMTKYCQYLILISRCFCHCNKYLKI